MHTHAHKHKHTPGATELVELTEGSGAEVFMWSRRPWTVVGLHSSWTPPIPRLALSTHARDWNL